MSRLLFSLFDGTPSVTVPAVVAQSVPGRVEARITAPAGVTVSATNSGGGPTSVTIPAGSYYLTAAGGISGLLAAFQSALNTTRAPSTGSWAVSLDTTTGLVSISCTGTWSLSWTSTTLRDLLGFTANISGVATTQTGTKQARGLWLPGCVLNVADSDPRQAPIKTDLRSTMSPTGSVLGLWGNQMFRHATVSWPVVNISQVWEQNATTANASWQQFFTDTQLATGGLGWFSVLSPIQIYDHTNTLVGTYGNSGAGLSGWQIVSLSDINPKRYDPNGWVGLWRLELPSLVSAG